jgi:hypothetical protein
MSFLWVWLGAMLGCGSAPSCANGADVLVEAGGQRLTCGEADVVPRYLARLSGRGLAQGDRGLALGAIGDKFTADPAGTRKWLEDVTVAGAQLEGPQGLPGAEKLSHAVWQTQSGHGLISPSDDQLWNLSQRTLSIWGKDDQEQLALTENDIEGWIRYMSLCREAQNADTLKLSVADRVTVYSMVVDAFNGGTREQQVALVAIGPFWSEVKDRWQSATYEQQQSWLKSAPLPPPMAASSLGYAETLLQGDVARHARVLHEQLGPFSLGYGETPFAGPGGSVQVAPAAAGSP